MTEGVTRKPRVPVQGFGNTNRHQLERILCISPLFAPAANAEAFCATKMVQALRQRGISVTVVASSNLYQGLRKDDSRLWDSIPKDTIDVLQYARPNLPHAIAAALQFQTPFYARWVGDVVKIAKQLHQANRFDLVYSRSLPMVAHIVGFWCAKKLGLPWIANFNDPWDFCFYSGATFHKSSVPAACASRFWLRRVLRKADLITYPCKSLHDFHAELASFHHSAEVIPHIGYAPEHSDHDNNRRFRLLHAGSTGTWDVTGRSTKALLLGLKSFVESSAEAAARTSLVLVGPEDEKTQSWIRKLELQENVEIVGKVNYEKSLAYVASASVCVLIEAQMDQSIFFASKLADYLVCGKPVLALSPPRGLAADFAQRGELIRADHDGEAVRKAIATLYSEFVRGTLTLRAPSHRVIAELRGDSVARKFLAACQSVISRSQTEGGRLLGKTHHTMSFERFSSTEQGL